MKPIDNFSISTFFICIIFFSSSCKEEPVEKNDEIGAACRNEPHELFASCVNKADTTLLELATWNLEFFPQQGTTTVTAVKNILNSFHADVIALQEIEKPSDLFDLAGDLPDWDAQVFNSGFLSLGFIYNTCEITSVTGLKVVDIGDSYSFPRKPVEMKITHRNGLEVVLINIHLKCCDNGYERRIAASELLKTYIDENYPDQNVILTGDFNDRIDYSGSPFNNFITDNVNYLFADMDIAKGVADNYSYPSYPSHIDHILISNELFDRIRTVNTIKFEPCFKQYSTIVSDHRPVIISLTPEE